MYIHPTYSIYMRNFFKIILEIIFQIGEEGVEEFVREIRQALTLTAADRGASLEARTEVMKLHNLY